MAGLNQSFEQIFVLSNPTLLASGTTVDLGVGQLGIFDKRTYEATTAPTYAKNKTLIFAQGRPDLSYLSDFIMSGFDSSSHKSKEVFGKKITEWTGKKASRGQQEIITIGYDGADITKNLTGFDGVNKNLYLKLTGQPMTKLYSEQGMLRQYIVGGECFDCENTESDPEKIADELVSKINSDKYVNKYIRASKTLYAPGASVPVTVSYTKYTVTVTDNGDFNALTYVQVQYPGKSVKLIARDGYLSTYEIVQLTSASAPAAVSVSQPIYVPDCTTCPAGFTLVSEQKLFLVERPITPTTDLTTSGARQTYADTLKTAYNADNGVGAYVITNPGTNSAAGLYTSAPTVGLTGGGGSGAAGTAVLETTAGIKSITINTGGTTYTNGTWPIVFTGGGGTGAAGTATVAGGIFTAMNITAAGAGYTSVPTVTVPAAGAGSSTAAFTAVRGYRVASITATTPGTGYTSNPTVALTSGGGSGATATAQVTGANVTTATYVSHDSATAKVLLYVDLLSGDITAGLASDVVIKLNTTGAICTPPAATTTAWSSIDTLLSYQKPIKVTVGDDCGLSVLAQIQAAYPTLVITQRAGTPTDTCVHLYDSFIYSEPVANDCSIDQLKFTFPSPYKGSAWIDNTAEVAPLAGKVAGVKIEAAFVDRVTGECTYDYFPKEYDGIHLEASFYNPDYNADPCDTSEWAITKVQGIEYPHGDGYMVRKLEDRQNSLLLKERSFSPAVREVEGYHSNSKLNKYYDEYTLAFDFSWKVLGWSDTYTDSYRITFFVEEGQGKPLEAAINSYVTSVNIALDPVVL